MSRYSDDSDSDSSLRRSKKKKYRRSRSRSREKKSRQKSRERRRRSRSRSKDRRHRNRDRNRRRSRSRDRRSRSLSSSRSREDVGPSRDTSEVKVVEERQPVEPVTLASISEQLKRARAIADIDSDSFSQKGFKSSAVRSEKKEVEEIGFEFGTSMERKQISEAEEKLEQINKEGIFHPKLFGSQEAREKRYLQHIWTIRQRAIQKNKT